MITNGKWSWRVNYDAREEADSVTFRDNGTRILYRVSFSDGYIAWHWCNKSHARFFVHYAHVKNIVPEVKIERKAA